MGLPVLGVAPEFKHPGHWFNTGGQSLSMAHLRGRVVLIDFWTYTCINCIRTLPYLEAWDARYRKAGLTIVGVHTPEFPFERDTGNVANAIRTERIRYPVVQDNDYGTWSAYQNQYWPAEYLIDARGRVRYTHFGEGEYDRSERAIRTLLAERGRTHLASGLARVHALHPPALATPETYVGTERADGFVVGPLRGGHDYGPPPARLPLNAFALGGLWSESPVAGTAVGHASIDVQFEAQRVYVVLGPTRGKRAHVRVLLDGHPQRTITVDRQRLYNVVALPRERTGHLSLRFDSGISAYSFTFG
jgi:thiol-disulfide isomerase/thioredoxin